MTALLALLVTSGRMVRIDLPAGTLSELAVDVGAGPDGVVVHDRVAYWTTMGRPQIDPSRGAGEAGMDFSERNGGVHAIALDGTGRRDVVAPGGLTTGKQLTSDGADTLYWSDREGCRISRVHADGTGLTDLVINAPVEDTSAECVGIAVDAARGLLYWTQKGPSDGNRGRIFRAGLEIPAGQTASDRTDIDLLWDGLPEPIDLELTEQWLYWTDRGAPPRGNTLNRAPVPPVGATGSPPQILTDGLHEAIGLAVDERAGLAYVSDLGGDIYAVDVSGDTAAPLPHRIVASCGEPVTGIALIPTS